MNHPLNIYLTCCYRFERKSQTPPHSHKNAYQLFYCMSGKSLRTCFDQKITLSAGQAMLVGPDTVHGMLSSDCEVLDIKFSVSDDSLANHLNSVTCQQISCEPASRLFLQSAELTKNPTDYAERLQELYLETALYTIFSSRSDLCRIQKSSDSHGFLNNTQVGDHIERKIIPFIDGYIILPAEKFTVAKMAREIGYNSRYLARQFSNEMGISLTKYYYNRRIAIAKHFLDTTDLPVSDIAAILGYDDVTYFVKYFKKNTGLLPKTYRAQSHHASPKDSSPDSKE